MRSGEFSEQLQNEVIQLQLQIFGIFKNNSTKVGYKWKKKTKKFADIF